VLHAGHRGDPRRVRGGGVAGFLERLPEADRDALLAVAGERRYAPGVALFHGCDDQGAVLLVRSGQAKITVLGRDGHEVILGFRGPGELLGELSSVDAAPRSATATALEPMTALGIPGDAFRHLLDHRPAVARTLLGVLATRLREADRQRLEFAAYDVPGRLARRLVELAERFGEPTDDGIEIALALSQGELAGWTSCSREAVSKGLGTLRGRGWIETTRRRIVVRDVEALRRYAP
jgi:CRP/FNR family transcriptional regulator, cyclic AMP receptor protein